MTSKRDSTEFGTDNLIDEGNEISQIVCTRRPSFYC